MNIKTYQSGSVQNLYDHQRDTNLQGVLYFNASTSQPNSLEVQETEPKVAVPDYYSSSMLEFAFKVDAIVFPILLVLYRFIISAGKSLLKIADSLGDGIYQIFSNVFSLLTHSSLEIKKPQLHLPRPDIFQTKHEVVTEKVKRSGGKIRLNTALFMQYWLIHYQRLNLGKLRMVFAGVCLLVSFVSIMMLLSPLVIAQMGTFSTLKATPVPSPTPFKYDHYYTPAADSLYPIKEFRLSVPKIGLESNVVDNVDPNIEGEYKEKLQYGIAHAKGSYLPPETGGPVYLFAHSTDTIFNIARFNAKFYSLRELEPRDEINVVFNEKQYTYSVKEKFIINPDQVERIQSSDSDLILQTCWPPGTDWQRLIVLAERKEAI